MNDLIDGYDTGSIARIPVQFEYTLEQQIISHFEKLKESGIISDYNFKDDIVNVIIATTSNYINVTIGYNENK